MPVQQHQAGMMQQQANMLCLVKIVLMMVQMRQRTMMWPMPSMGSMVQGPQVWMH